jgi:predicted DNA-binding protein YlxM (UPF0122 family)
MAEVIRLYTEDKLSLAEVGDRFGVSRQAIYSRLVDFGVPIRSKREAKGIVREREISATLATHGALITEALLDGQRVADVATDLDVLPAAVQRVYSGLDPVTKRGLRYKGSRRAYTDEELLGCVQTVADIHECTPGVTTYNNYRKAFPEMGLPHSMTIVKRFDTWSKAVTEAGLTPNRRPPKGTGEIDYTDKQIGKALHRAAKHLAGPPSIADYKAAKEMAENDPANKLVWPAAGTIITRYDGWIEALRTHFPNG